MDPTLQESADRRLEESIRVTGARDPREECRALLRQLRINGDEAYAGAVDDYHSAVVRAIAEDGADPLVTWLAFGVRLAERLSPGRTVAVDRTGRAREYAPPPSAEDLILHLPDERRARAIAVGTPSRPTAAQQATLDLLALGRVKPSEPEGVSQATERE